MLFSFFKKSDASKSSSEQKLEEGIDFYIEDGKYVFTAYYLKKRGYCCGSGCRHCPYPKKENRS